MPGPLTAAESAALEEAARLIEAGAIRTAAEKLAPLIRAGSTHPDLLLTYSIACEQLGLFNEAAGAAQHAIQTDPQRADLWAHFGRLLSDADRPADAVNILERAVAIDPAVATHWYNLGVAALSGGLLDRSVEALQRAVDLDRANAAGWAALGVAQQQAGALEQSEQSLRRGLDLDPSLLTAAHNLAVTLRLLDRSSEALVLLERAIGAGLAAEASLLLRSHLLADLDRFEEAVSGYRAIIGQSPAAIDAHEVLARLLPQLGHGTASLDAFDDALHRAPTPELYRSALKAAWELKDAAALERWSGEALRRFGDLPDLKLMQGLAHGLAGQSDKAMAVIDALIAGGFAPALAQGAYLRLKLGDLAEAERHAVAATRADFADQSAWAYLTTIWRLMADPRERWLADYAQFVLPVDLQPPEEFADAAEFMRALAEELTGLHATLEHPADQSLRQGTQTRGNLFDKRRPLIRQLAASVQQAIDAAMSMLPSDPTHPFLSRNTGQTRFLGSWSVRLRSGGFHVSHIHQFGWLSSALYIALPPEMSDAREPVPPGALTFGVPDAQLGLDLEPRRVEVPQVGRLVLFPSYFWHGTMPFESKDYRLTVAFDAAPA